MVETCRNLVAVGFLAACFGASVTLYYKTDHDGPSRTAARIAILWSAVGSLAATVVAMAHSAPTWLLAVVLFVSAEVGHRLTVYADGGLTRPAAIRALSLLAWTIVLSAVAWHWIRAALRVSPRRERC